MKAATAVGLSDYGRRCAWWWCRSCIRLALPGLSNLWLSLLKDTALVSVIAWPTLLRKTDGRGRVSPSSHSCSTRVALPDLSRAGDASSSPRAIWRSMPGRREAKR